MTEWPDLGALALLVAVADTGSLSGAARACKVAQPNASRSIARLERSLALPLVHRATTGATLTTEGLMIVDWARPILAGARHLQSGVAALRQDESAPLDVMASQTVAEHFLPRWVSIWQQQHPDSGIRVSVGNSTDVLAATRAGEIAVGFIEGPGAPKGLNSHVVAHDDLVLCVAPHLPLAQRQHINADELACLHLVTREPGSGTRVALDRELSPLVAAEPVVELKSNAAVKVSAIAGTGPAVISREAVKDALATGILVEVPVSDLDLRRKLRAVWAGPRRMTNGAAAALVTIAARDSTA